MLILTEILYYYLWNIHPITFMITGINEEADS